jgi:hypothetical protein
VVTQRKGRHLIETVHFRTFTVSCRCGWSSTGTDVESAWRAHRSEHGQIKQHLNRGLGYDRGT